MANIQLTDIQEHLGRTLKFSLLGGVLLFGSFGCTKKTAPQKESIRSVKAMIVADAKPFTERRFPGKATATQEVNLSFDVSGTVVERPVNIGDTVKKGQLIAQLDQRDFRANVKAAKAALKRDQKNFVRARELIKEGHISRLDYDQLEATLEVSDANLSVASKALADSVMSAPFDGRIANLFAENHQAVRAKQEIARLLDASSVEFTIQIPEQLISLAAYIQDIQVEFDSNPGHPIPAIIKEIGTEASATTRTYPVTLIMEQTDGFEILPGMSGSATGRPERPDKLMAKDIMVPVTAVFTAGESSGNFIWVIDEKTTTVSRRTIQIGELRDTGIPVTSGLKAGERVVIAGVSYLREGQEVKLLDQHGGRKQ